MSPPEDGGTLASRALASHGIDLVFALPGSHVRTILRALPVAGIRQVTTRHEENAVLMAAGTALATGRVGVACVTAGPGLSNALPGIAEANASGIPVVVIAGRTSVPLRHRGAVQDLPQLELVTPITKWRAACLSTERIPEYIGAAIHHATTGSPGVAYLEVAEDLLEAPVGIDAGWVPGFAAPARPVPEPAAVDHATGMLASAQRPAALAGSGAFFSGAGDALRRFTEITGIPVVTTSAARGLLPDDHPHCAGSLVHGGAAMLSSDVPLLLGSRFNANLLYGRPPLFAPDAEVIQVDIRAEHTGGMRRPGLALVGDVGATLDMISGSWSHGPARLAGWREDALGAADSSRLQWRTEADREADGVHPGRLAHTAAEFADRVGAPFVVDGGDSVIWGLAFGTARGPGRHVFLGSAMGTLGVGLPYALAASLAHGPAVLFTGDGAFGLSAMELDTAAREEAPLLVVVVNNGGWGRQRPGSADGVRYHLLAEAVGGTGLRAERIEEVPQALEEGWEAVLAGRPSVVDVVTTRGVHSEFMQGMASLAVM